MAVSGDQWPIFVYQGYSYDPEDPWNGLLRSTLLVSVSYHEYLCILAHTNCLTQGYKHIFTSPSSVEKEPKATRSGNARINGMTHITAASISYIATQVDTAFLSGIVVFRRPDLPHLGLDSICTLLIISVLQDRYSNRFRNFLQFHP